MPCRGASLLPALIDQLPATAAAPGQSITLPKAALAPSQPAERKRLRHLARDVGPLPPPGPRARNGSGETPAMRQTDRRQCPGPDWQATPLPPDGVVRHRGRPLDRSLAAHGRRQR
jgi:hypothetical protein